jgi:dienelactone hydrolase
LPKRSLLAIAVLGVAALSGVLGARYVHALSFIIRASGAHGLLGRLAQLDTLSDTARTIRLRLPRGEFAARVYTPSRQPRQTVLLVSGLHPAGIDERRLVAFAHELARSGVIVVTPDFPELRTFEITPVLTDEVTQAALAITTDRSLAPGGRIGLMGISFSGGLAIVAAGREALRNHLLYVFALGGHDDLPRVLRYLSTGVEPAPPDARVRGASPSLHRPPHIYGVAIVLLVVADRLVPAVQVAPLREGVRRFLQASYFEEVDRPAAAQQYAAVAALASTLPAPAGPLLSALHDSDVAALEPLLLAHLGSLPDTPELSPSRSPAPTVPVFLLHGSSDTLIPSAESEFLASRFRDRVPVRLLVTDLVSHAEATERARFSDLLRATSFWEDLFSR